MRSCLENAKGILLVHFRVEGDVAEKKDSKVNKTTAISASYLDRHERLSNIQRCYCFW